MFMIIMIWMWNRWGQTQRSPGFRCQDRQGGGWQRESCVQQRQCQCRPEPKCEIRPRGAWKAWQVLLTLSHNEKITRYREKIQEKVKRKFEDAFKLGFQVSKGMSESDIRSFLSTSALLYLPSWSAWAMQFTDIFQGWSRILSLWVGYGMVIVGL